MSTRRCARSGPPTSRLTPEFEALHWKCMYVQHVLDAHTFWSMRTTVLGAVKRGGGGQGNMRSIHQSERVLVKIWMRARSAAPAGLVDPNRSIPRRANLSKRMGRVRQTVRRGCRARRHYGPVGGIRRIRVSYNRYDIMKTLLFNVIFEPNQGKDSNCSTISGKLLIYVRFHPPSVYLFVNRACVSKRHTLYGQQETHLIGERIAIGII